MEESKRIRGKLYINRRKRLTFKITKTKTKIEKIIYNN